MSTAAVFLKPHGGPEVRKFPDKRLRIRRKWFVPYIEYARPAELETYLFQPWGTPDGDFTGVDPKFVHEPLPEDVYPDALLVDQFLDERPDGVAESDATALLVKDYEILAPDVLTPAGKAITKTGPNGLLEHDEFFIGRLDYDVSQFEEVGTSRGTDPQDKIRGKEVFLGAIEDEDNHYAKVVTKRWVEPGILNTDKVFDDDLLFVTFESQGKKFIPTLLNPPATLTSDPLVAFQDGDPAIIFRDRIRNVNGFRRYTVTVMMKKDGSGLGDDDVVSSFTTWDEYLYPGSVDTSFDDGIIPYPGGQRAVKVLVEERLNTTASVVNINYTPEETGLSESMNKAFGMNFLAGWIGLTGNNSTFMGMSVSSIAGGGGSNPTYAGFLATTEPILSEKIVGEFTTDEGEAWYRIRKVTLVGKFGDYPTP